MLRLAYISLLSRYIPPSAIGCVADFSPHKGKFGEAAIQQALCYRGYTSSEETSDVVLERVIARWNSERKAGMLIIGYRRIAENMSKKTNCTLHNSGKLVTMGVPAPSTSFSKTTFYSASFLEEFVKCFHGYYVGDNNRCRNEWGLAFNEELFEAEKQKWNILVQKSFIQNEGKCTVSNLFVPKKKKKEKERGKGVSKDLGSVWPFS